MANTVEIWTKSQLEERGWDISVAEQPDASFSAVASKTYPSDEVYERQIAGYADENAAEDAICTWASAIEYGNLYRMWRPTEMYFGKDELHQWISPQQLEQFERMYPDCVEISYQSALGMLYSQIGELYDIQTILAGQTTDGTVKIMRWMLSVLTAYNLTSPANKHSQTLDDNFQLVMKKVTEMKTGASTLSSAPILEEPNAWPVVVSNKRKMLG